MEQVLSTVGIYRTYGFFAINPLKDVIYALCTRFQEYRLAFGSVLSIGSIDIQDGFAKI